MPTNSPRPSTSRANSYWINIEAGGHAPVAHVRAISVTMRYPAHVATVEIRKVSLSKTDAGDAILDGGAPLIDDFGQYIHADWPGKARNVRSAAARVEPGRPHARAQGRGVAPAATAASPPDGAAPAGFFRVEKLDNRWWFIDPEGCRFWSAGVNGAGAEPPRTPIVGRDKLFASIPTRAQEFPRRARNPIRCAIRCRSMLANLRMRFGAEWRRRSAQLTSRRMRAWGLNTAYGAALNDALTVRVAARSRTSIHCAAGRRIAGAIMGMPDVYSDAFARRVDPRPRSSSNRARTIRG